MFIYFGKKWIENDGKAVDHESWGKTKPIDSVDLYRSRHLGKIKTYRSYRLCRCLCRSPVNAKIKTYRLCRSNYPAHLKLSSLHLIDSVDP